MDKPKLKPCGNERYECPNCYAQKENGWDFWPGLCNAEDGQLEPDYGECSKCGFRYSQHVWHPIEEQMKAFRQRRPVRRINPTTGMVERNRRAVKRSKP